MPLLEAFLGRPIDRLTFADLQRLVETRAAEDTQLDFKRQLYDDGEEMAADVVAMANSTGGAIVIGVEEKDGIASALLPVQLSDQTAVQMRQWLASLTAPRVHDVDVRPIPSADPAAGVYIINVPRSPTFPHAVVKKMALRYYYRAGPARHPMSEAQVAEAYQSRFSRLRQREERLEAITKAAAPSSYSDEPHFRAWVAVTLIPGYPGVMDISARRLRELEKWADTVCEPLHRGMVHGNARAFPNIERVSVTTRNKETDPPFGYYLHLYTDGAASAAGQLLTEDLVYGPGKPPAGLGIYADELVRKAAECLRVAASHASANTGVRGSALVRCALHFASGPARLGYAHFNSWEGYHPPREIPAPALVGMPRGIDLDPVLSDPVEWMSATRVVVTDLFHAFALPEVIQITEGGAFNTNYWRHDMLTGWKAVQDV